MERMKLLRGWAFPVGLLMAWTIAAGYTVHELGGVQGALGPAAAPVESRQLPEMAGPAVVIDVPRPTHAS